MWKRQWFTGTFREGDRELRRIPLAYRAGVMLFTGDGVVVVVYDEGRGADARYSVRRSSFVRLVPSVASMELGQAVPRILTREESEEYVDQFVRAVRDVEDALVEVFD